MDKPKALIFGASGLVGQYIAKSLKDKFSITGTDNKFDSEDDLTKLDFTDFNKVTKLFNRLKPDLVVNAVNLAGGVDFCEKEKLLAKKYHFDAIVNMCENCRRHDSVFVFISTDYVFDGKAGPYSEDSDPNPLNLYGLLKLMAEEAVARMMTRYLIVRTTNVYGYDPDSQTPNYVTSVIRKLSVEETIRAPFDQLGNPVLAGNLSDAIADLLDQEKYGLYNIAGPDRINRYEWAKMIAQTFGFDTSLIEAVPTSVFTLTAPRPLESGFLLDKVQAELRIDLVPVAQGLARVKSQMLESEKLE